MKRSEHRRDVTTGTGMNTKVPRDKNAADNDAAAVTRMKAQLVARQSPLSIHLAQIRSERQNTKSDGSTHSTS
jgi:hypothetical protein